MIENDPQIRMALESLFGAGGVSRSGGVAQSDYDGRGRSRGSSGSRILQSLVMLDIYWGAISLHRSKWRLGNTVLKTVATPEQFEKFKNLTIAIAITEPGAGSDPANIRTTATFDRETGEWVLNGEKVFISQAQSADAAMVRSRFIGPHGSRGMTTFLVEKGTPGFTVGPQLKKLGIRSHDTCNLMFENCRIPEFNHIKGDFKSTMSVFNDSRPMVGAMALCVARTALDFTRDKLSERGIEVCYRGGMRSRSAVVDRFIRLEAICEAALLTVLCSKWLEQQAVPPQVEASIAKAAGGKAARKITRDASTCSARRRSRKTIRWIDASETAASSTSTKAPAKSSA